MGLAFTRALAAKEMGVALTVHSDSPGKGAKFTLELPLYPSGRDRLKNDPSSANNEQSKSGANFSIACTVTSAILARSIRLDKNRER